MSFCCFCAGSCNHVGPHAFCAAHGGYGMTPVMPGQLNPPLQNTPSINPHAACDARIKELEAERDAERDKAQMERRKATVAYDRMDDAYNENRAVFGRLHAAEQRAERAEAALREIAKDSSYNGRIARQALAALPPTPEQ